MKRPKMRAMASAMAWCLWFGAPHAQTAPPKASSGGNDVVPCTNLPAAAVNSVPAPFDRYMTFVCYRFAGQGLRAVDGFHWASPQGFGINLSASKPGPPDAKGNLTLPFSWYTRLQPVELSSKDQATMATDFKRVVRPEYVDGAKILELRATTSNAEEKLIVLVVPDDKPGLPKWLLGFECNGSCFHDDPQPMLFAGEPN